MSLLLQPRVLPTHILGWCTRGRYARRHFNAEPTGTRRTAWSLAGSPERAGGQGKLVAGRVGDDKTGRSVETSMRRRPLARGGGTTNRRTPPPPPRDRSAVRAAP